MRKIFISYRRSEAEYAAGALGRELRRRFGDSQIFRDKEDIGGGAAWKQQLLHEIDRDSALLVLIGKDWADAKDAQGRRRLDKPDDGLRLEISDGIKDGAAIIPVLLENAQMPSESELPNDLQRLADFNAVRLRDGDWERDFDAICRTLAHAGFREVDSPQPVIQTAVALPVVKKRIAVKSIIAGVLLFFAFAALASDDLNRDGHLGVVFFAGVAAVLGILTWRENGSQATLGKVGALVTVLGVLGIFGGIGGMDATGVPEQTAGAQPATREPALDVSSQPAGGAASTEIAATELRAQNTAGLTTLELLRGHALIRLDPKVWQRDLKTMPAGYFQYIHANGEVYIKVISERTEIGKEQLAEIGVKNAQATDPNVKVTRRSARRVNGVDMQVREFEATIDGVRVTFYAHYYSDAAGSIQLVGWSGRNLIDESRPSIDQFVAGFTLNDRKD